MTNIEKFRTDIFKIIKREKAENGDRYNVQNVCENIIKLFIANTHNLGDMPNALCDFWKDTYIDYSKKEEPTEEHIDKLVALLSFLYGEIDEKLSQNDWQEIAQITSYEAEDLPVEQLSQFMKILVEKKAI